MPGIFISYRREDCLGHARVLFETFRLRFRKESTFIDLDAIPLGKNFRNIIEQRVAACDALIALIGKDWLSCVDEEGNRRLDDPGDFVRLEIVSALNRNVVVIPVLVDGARIPRARDMPDPLAELVQLQALELSNTRYSEDVNRLTRALKRILAAADKIRRDAAETQRLGAEKAEAERLAVDKAKAEQPVVEKAEEHPFTPPFIQAPPGPLVQPPLLVLDPPGIRLLRMLASHSKSVSAVAASPDGRRAVSASWDKTIKVWDLETDCELRTLAVLSYEVLGVAVSPDGRRAVSASWKTLKVWDLETGRELRTLASHTSYVSGVAISPDGRRVVSASHDNTLKVWDLETVREPRTLAGHSSFVSGVVVCPDGRRTVSASSDKTLKVWDLETGREQLTLAGHSSYVSGVAVSLDGRRAVSASGDKTIKVWDLETGHELCTLTGHSDYVWGVAVSPDGRCIVSASADKTLKVWDLATGRSIATFICDTALVCCAFASDRTIIAGDQQGRIHFLSLELPSRG
jgi:WD40 repeat protein